MTEQQKPPYEVAEWEDKWAHEGPAEHVEARIRGLEVLHRIEAGLPLSPREAAVSQQVHNNPGWQEYREVGTDEAAIARIMADNIGTALTRPQGALIGTPVDYVDISMLSDERPTEAQQ